MNVYMFNIILTRLTDDLTYNYSPRYVISTDHQEKNELIKIKFNVQTHYMDRAILSTKTEA